MSRLFVVFEAGGVPTEKDKKTASISMFGIVPSMSRSLWFPLELPERRVHACNGRQDLSVGRPGHGEIVSRNVDCNWRGYSGRQIDHGGIEKPGVGRLQS